MRISMLLAIMALTALLGCTEKKMEAPPRIKPWQAPEFTLKNLKGKSFSLLDFKGKPVIVNFWATWCRPCLKEMPELDKLYRAKKDDGLVMLGINLKESKEVVEDFIQKNGYAFHFLLDEEGKVSESFQVFGLPTTYFIDGSGVVRHQHMGELTREIIYFGLDTITGGKDL